MFYCFLRKKNKGEGASPFQLSDLILFLLPRDDIGYSLFVFFWSLYFRCCAVLMSSVHFCINFEVDQINTMYIYIYKIGI